MSVSISQRRRLHGFLRGLGCLSVAVVLGGCGASPAAPSAVPNAILAAVSPEEKLRAAEQQWATRNVSRYDFSVLVGCFCLPFPPPLFFQVRDGVSVAPNLDDVTRARFAHYESIDSLFGILRETLARDPDTFEVEYHPSLGYPMTASIDISRLLRDEEFGFVVQTFRIVP